MAGKTILEVQNLTKFFNTPGGQLHAVDGVSFKIEEGRTLGIVGESGCGKSTTGRTILKLLEPTGGKILFDGKDITNYSRKQMRPLRQEMQMVFQDPFSSLDPRQTVMQLISEPIIEHKLLKSKSDIEERTLELMRTVGLAERYMNVYPHELDGGRRQRIGIARALAVRPKLIVCDEPVSALDVSIQAQILNLLKKLQADLGLTYIFITQKPVRQLIRGEITSPVNLPDECRFMKRCDCAAECCKNGNPQLREIEPGHFVACTRVGEF